MRRRFIAFLLMCVTALMGIVTGVITSTKNLNTGMEFSSSTTFVYQIENENEESLVDLDVVSKEMERRLKMADAAFYNIEKEGEDQIRVTVGGEEATVQHVKLLMAYNADFTLATIDGEVQYTGDELFGDEEAYVDYVNQYPVVVFPIVDSTKMEIIRNHAQDLLANSSSTGEGEQETNEDAGLLVLWADKEEGDDYDTAIDSSNPDYEKIQAKVFLTFNSEEENLYYDDKHEAIAKTVSYSDSEGNEPSNPTKDEVSAACVQAKQVANFFNAGSLDYEVKYLYQSINEPSVENLVVLGSNSLYINYKSGIVIASLVGFIFAGLFLAINYKVGSIVALLSSAGTFVTTILLYNGLSVEFGLGTIIGLFIIAILAIFTNVVIFEKVKDELHKGRTLKKANTEGQKRANFLVVDLSVTLLVLSFLSFFIGGTVLRELAVVVALGSVVNLVVTWLGNKILMWALCNDTALQSHKGILGVSDKNIPDTLNEEKQRYFGDHDGKDFTKHSKLIGGITGGLGLAAVIVTIVFGAINKPVFNYGSEYDATYRIQFKMENDSDLAEAATLISVLDSHDIKLENGLTFDELVDEDDKDVVYAYYSGAIKKLPGEDNAILSSNVIYDTNGDVDVLATIQENLLLELSTTDSEIEIKVSNVYKYDSVIKTGMVVVAIGCGVLIAGLYLFIRYGLSKAIASILITELTGLLTVGVFVLTRMVYTDSAILGLFGVVALTLMSCILMFNRDKELSFEIKEITSKDRLVKTVNTVFGPIMTISVLTFFMSAFFIGFGPAEYMTLFLLLAFGSAVSLLVVTSLLGPSFFTFRKGFSKIKFGERKHKKNKNTNNEQHKSAEPEEAIFIGIND